MADAALRLSRLQWAILIVALIGIALSIAGALPTCRPWRAPGWSRRHLDRLSARLPGAAARLAPDGGRWGLALGGALEAVARTLPLLALLFLPLLFELQAVYPWARPEFLAGHETVARKAAFLDPPFFILRSLIYLAIWAGLALILTTARGRLDERGQRRGLATVGAILYALTASFAAIDWLLSLQPEFHSAVLGMLAMSGQAVGGSRSRSWSRSAWSRPRAAPTSCASTACSASAACSWRWSCSGPISPSSNIS